MTCRRCAAMMRPLIFAMMVTNCSDHGAEPPSSQAPSSSPQPIAEQFIAESQVPAVTKSRIKIEPVTLRSIPEVVSAPGEVSLDLKRAAKVAPRIEGKVEHLYVFLGDHVRKGQSLASIGSPRLDELVQDYLIAKSQTETAESNFRRTQKLADEGIAPERRLIEERGRYREVNTRYQHMREKLLALGMTPDELRALERANHEESHRYLLKSPIAGTIVKQNVVLGQGVSPEKELFEVVDTTHVWVFAHLPIEQASRLKPGDPGTIVRKGGDTVPTVLRDISPVADNTTRTIRVRFDVPNPEQRLKPNEYVEVQLTKDSTALLAIPATAITLIQKTRGAFVLRDNGYTFLPLEVGREEGAWAEVRKGLSEGDKVVTSGVFDLKSLLLKEAIQTGEEG